jgi:hypothetical protein
MKRVQRQQAMHVTAQPMNLLLVHAEQSQSLPHAAQSPSGSQPCADALPSLPIQEWLPRIRVQPYSQVDVVVRNVHGALLPSCVLPQFKQGLCSVAKQEQVLLTKTTLGAGEC